MTVRESEHVTVTDAQSCLLIAVMGADLRHKSNRDSGERRRNRLWYGMCVCGCVHYLSCCCIAVHAMPSSVLTEDENVT
jgi:hypothetical protein